MKLQLTGICAPFDAVQEMGFLLLTPRKCLQQSLVLRLPQLMQYPSRMLNTSKREGTVPLGVKPRSLDLMEGVTDLSIMASRDVPM